ncbi:hypothetical protein [Tsuneonella suprasediminis]|uniref:hypothetical protein n=1 Tax=Tsuneonella suprasediminis TaxID=2306996 RepID=UPI002F943F1A
MIALRRPIALRPLAVVLTLILLVFATVADAATCGSEPVASNGWAFASSVEQADWHDTEHDGNSDAPTEQHSICSHGHCHHGSKIESRLADILSHTVGALHFARRFADLHSVDCEILSPPPRA